MQVMDNEICLLASLFTVVAKYHGLTKFFLLQNEDIINIDVNVFLNVRNLF